MSWSNNKELIILLLVLKKYHLIIIIEKESILECIHAFSVSKSQVRQPLYTVLKLV